MRNPSEETLEDSPFEYTLSLIGGKWKMQIIYRLARVHTQRYGELKRSVPGITHKMLSMQLKELESSGLVSRKVFTQVPPKVEYELTDKGRTLMPVLDAMCNWGVANRS
ncbi:helix-turn-helix domain-containing protein [Saccharibacillus sp. CPCC 101409]|uniref:winged helix-turn-helix transcriptional regulator n=1 Tax=Saccharibacillus sp. CPCC 101409 TaxID=3058041 RepID=UPI002673C836|nr:helix-turn-helix domain-containing protein [Saccharibacillus sp. CPCC 101409]MDO3410345.1 helix-turn-helix domain-containing protein [Saccharibacillus sp. CPCC 101409]